MVSLLAVPFLASAKNKNFNMSNIQQIIDILERLNGFSNYVNSREPRGYYNNRRYNKNNFYMRNNYRNSRYNKTVYYDHNKEIFGKIKDFLNELNGDK